MDSIQVISRALLMLEILSRSEQPMALLNIAQAAALPKSTVHRLLKALEADGYVKAHGAGNYGFGRSLICLGAKVVRGGLISQADSVMKHLKQQTDCTIYLSSINNEEVVYLHKISGAITPASNAGWSGNIYCSTGGRMLLSFYTSEKLHKLFSCIPIVPRTPQSIATPEEFLDEMQRTRERGYSKSYDEYTIGVDGIAAPVFDSTGECIAAMSIVAIKGTISCDVEAYAQLLLEAVRDLSERLGYTG